MSLSFGQQKSKAKPVIDPAAISKEERAQLFTPIGNLLGFNFSPVSGFTPQDVTQQFGQIPMEGINKYREMLESAFTNPYTPTLAENQLLENIMSQTSSQFARRGLGTSPIAASSVAGSIAPSLIAMRQQQLAKLFQGLGGELQLGQNLLTERGQDINALLGQRGIQLQGLLNFLEQVGFRRQLGQKSSGFNFEVGIGSKAATPGKAAPGGGTPGGGTD